MSYHFAGVFFLLVGVAAASVQNPRGWAMFTIFAVASFIAGSREGREE